MASFCPVLWIAVFGAVASAQTQYGTTNDSLVATADGYACEPMGCHGSGCVCGTLRLGSFDFSGCISADLPSVCCDLATPSCVATTCGSTACTVQTGTCVSFEGLASTTGKGICLWDSLVPLLGTECVPLDGNGAPDPTTVIPDECVDTQSNTPWLAGDCNCDGVENGQGTGEPYCQSLSCPLDDGTDGGSSTADGGMNGDGGTGGRDGSTAGPTFTGDGGCTIAAGGRGHAGLVSVSLLLLAIVVRRRRRLRN